MFSYWYKRANTFIPHLEAWQDGALTRQLKKAYEAGRKQGRKEATALAENTTSHLIPNAKVSRDAGR